ncbi:MAG: hypothetical protein IKR95_04285 [Oscillospiraceae bacterium]|nr:hypothetical protein [Oscillospiraceae bacterium]
MQVDLKKLKPIGIVVILGAAVLALIVCFTADMGIPPKYESVHDADYYLQSEDTMNELAAELEENVFPKLEGIASYGYDPGSGKLRITVEKQMLGRVEQVLLRDFDARLFEFKEA